MFIHITVSWKKIRMKIKINSLMRNLTRREIKERRWRIPKFWDTRGKKISLSDYIISNDGIVIRIVEGKGGAHIGKISTIGINLKEYETIDLRKDGKRIRILFHRLMYETWIKKIPKEKQINHKNGIKWDNDPWRNLEAVTSKENMRHAMKKGLWHCLKGKDHPMYGKRGKDSPNYGRKNSLETIRKMSEAQRGEKHPGARLTQEKAKKILSLRYKKNWVYSKLMNTFDVSQGCIQAIVEGKSWNIEKLTKEELR